MCLGHVWSILGLEMFWEVCGGVWGCVQDAFGRLLGLFGFMIGHMLGHLLDEEHLSYMNQ